MRQSHNLLGGGSILDITHILHIQQKSSQTDAQLSLKTESRAIAREPRDATAVVFGLKFADNIDYKFKSSQASIRRVFGIRGKNCGSFVDTTSSES